MYAGVRPVVFCSVYGAGAVRFLLNYSRISLLVAVTVAVSPSENEFRLPGLRNPFLEAVFREQSPATGLQARVALIPASYEWRVIRPEFPRTLGQSPPEGCL